MEIQFIKDRLPHGLSYPCSIKEIKDILLKLPPEHINGIKRIRLSGQKGINADASYQGRTITIYAIPSEFKFVYNYKPSEKTIRGYSKYGAIWENIGNYWFCYWKNEHYKNYILYHVLLHEIGHHMDEYHKSRGSLSKEAFADNYAIEMEKFLKGNRRNNL